MFVKHSGDHNDLERTDPLEESIEDGAVKLSRDVTQSVRSRQQGDQPRGCAVCSWSNVKEKGPAVQLQRGQERRGINQIWQQTSIEL